MHKEFIKLAIRAAVKGGEIIKKGFYIDKNIEYKGFSNPVTEFDMESERIIVDCILKKYPNHSILAEEKLTSKGLDDVKWIIDPLDGTVNFTHQIPFVCVSIGIEIEGSIKAGVIYNPVMDELYQAVKDCGAYLNKKRIGVSKISDKGKSLIVTGFPYDRGDRTDSLIQPLKEILPEYCGFRRLGSAAMDMAYVARGSIEGFYEEKLNPWDTAAGKIIVEEAGGRVTDYYGKDYSIYGRTIIATNSLIHDGLVNIMKHVSEPV